MLPRPKSRYGFFLAGCPAYPLCFMATINRKSQKKQLLAVTTATKFLQGISKNKEIDEFFAVHTQLQSKNAETLGRFPVFSTQQMPYYVEKELH